MRKFPKSKGEACLVGEEDGLLQAGACIGARRRFDVFSHGGPLPFVDDRHGYATDTNQLFLFIGDAYFPHLRPVAQVDGFGYAVHIARLDRSQVICVDLQSNAVFVRIGQCAMRGDAAERFGQYYRGPSMKQAVRLMCSVIDRHFCFDVHFAKSRDFNSQVFHHGIAAQLVERLERDGRINYCFHTAVGYNCPDSDLFIFAAIAPKRCQISRN